VLVFAILSKIFTNFLITNILIFSQILSVVLKFFKKVHVTWSNNMDTLLYLNLNLNLNLNFNLNHIMAPGASFCQTQFHLPYGQKDLQLYLKHH